MMKPTAQRAIFFLIFWLLLLGAALLFGQTVQAALSDCIDATCRINAGESRGTGCVFEISSGKVFVLTNAHVVGQQSTVQCEFWRHGHKSESLPGKVIARVFNDRCDAAIISLDRALFPLLPHVVPIAPRGTMLRPGQTITSVGCAKAAWSTGWKGHVIGYSGGDLRFRPTPADGRSGSAIFDAGGTMIVALLNARSADNRQGIACSLESLYEGFKHKGTGSPAAHRPTQYCPPNCPNCPKGGFGGIRIGGGIGIGRQIPPQQQRPPAVPSPWTSPPGPAPAAPVAPLVPVAPPPQAPDPQIGEMVDKLDIVIEILRERQRQEELPADPGPMPPFSPPPIVLPEAPLAPEVLDVPVEVVDEQARGDVYQAMELATQTKSEQSVLKTAVQELLDDRKGLRERFDDRIAKVKEELGPDAGRLKVGAAYTKDLVKETVSGGGWTIGKLLAATVGASGPLAIAIAVGCWFLGRRIKGKLEDGEPLLVQRLWQRIDDRFDGLKDRIRERRNPESVEPTGE